MNDFMAPAHARWDPQVRHDMAMKKIRKAVELALGHPQVRFSPDDLDVVADMMQLGDHTDDTLPTGSGGDPSNRSSVRKSIDPDRRYRLPSGEVVTGAEVLRRRSEA